VAAGALAVLAVAGSIVWAADRVAFVLRDTRFQAHVAENLDVAIERAGGLAALERCGNVQSGYYWRALVASRLHVPIAFLDQPRDPTRVLVRAPPDAGEPYEPPRFRPGLTRRAAVPDWEIWVACPPL
jgi:hypothetical protein